MRTTATNITTRGRRWQKTITTSNCTTYHKTKVAAEARAGASAAGGGGGGASATAGAAKERTCIA